MNERNEKSVKWLCAAGVRAIKTVAQTAVATIGTAAVMGEVNWAAVVSRETFSAIFSATAFCGSRGFAASVLAGILSLLTSTAGLPEVE